MLFFIPKFVQMYNKANLKLIQLKILLIFILHIDIVALWQIYFPSQLVLVKIYAVIDD